MLRRVAEVASKAAAMLVVSSIFVAAHATAPRLTAEEMAACADNNPWVKSGYCEANNAWNKWKCLCPRENAGGGGDGGPEFASNDPEDNCGIKWPDTGSRSFKPSFKTFSFKPNFSPKPH
jgi:hypothetical protein